MTDEELGRSCCKWFIKFILAAGGIILFVFLALPHKPKCSIQYFYVPALNKSLNAKPLNTTLNFMVHFDNPNREQGIHYDDVHIFLSNTLNTSLLLAYYKVPRFYQGHHKKAKKWGQVMPVNNQTVLRGVLPNGSAVYRLDLKTQVRLKFMFFKTKKYNIEVGANVEVNGEGAKATKKGIRMKSSNSSEVSDYFEVEFGAGEAEARKKGSKKSDSSSPLRSSSPLCVLISMLVFFAIC